MGEKPQKGSTGAEKTTSRDGKTRGGAARLKEENLTLRQELDKLKEECEQVHERWLRAVADLDNMKKRSARDREEWTKYANENLLKQILPILDSLQRALDHEDHDFNMDAFVEGIQMIHKQFLSTLEGLGVKPIHALSQPFDPSRHEAIMQVESEDHEPNTVVQEMEKGYLLHDRLLRPARVVVSKRNES